MTFTPSCLLVTGGAGFIGTNFIRWVVGHHPDVQVINLDLLTYAANLESLEDVTGVERYYFVRADVRDFAAVSRVLSGNDVETGGDRRAVPAPDCVVHMAAQSHVDRSIMGPALFVDTNVRGTLALLEACRAELARAPRAFRLLHVSTDEVYGSLGERDGVFTRGRVGDVYNIGGRSEQPNIAVVQTLLKILAKPESLIRYVTDRAGHDRRYAINCDKLCGELGWEPRHTFEAGLAATVRWYLERRGWWERVLSEAYRASNALYLKTD